MKTKIGNIKIDTDQIMTITRNKKGYALQLLNDSPLHLSCYDFGNLAIALILADRKLKQ